MDDIIFSIVVAVYNSEDTIVKCIQSLLAQTFSDYEIIIVDDGCTDNTLILIKNFNDEKITLISDGNNRGPAGARNLGIKNAKGKYVCFTDADCIVRPEWLDRFHITYLLNDNIVGVGGILDPIKHNLIANLERLKNKKLYKMGYHVYIGKQDCPIGGTNNLSYKRSVLNEVGGFDETFPKPAGEDFDLKLRICEKGYKLAYVPVKVYHNQKYDLEYFLRFIEKRGVPFKLNKKFLLIKIVLLLPIIIPNIIFKVIKYKIKSKGD